MPIKNPNSPEKAAGCKECRYQAIDSMAIRHGKNVPAQAIQRVSNFDFLLDTPA